MNGHSGRLAPVVALVSTLLLAVVPRVLPDSAPSVVLGPLASNVLWLPAALWFAAEVMGDLASPSLGRILRLVARASVWLLPILVLIDPARNLPEMIASGLGDALDGVRAAVAGMVGMLVVAGIAGIVLGGDSSSASREDRTVVSTGSSIHPLVAILVRLVLRLATSVFTSLLGVALLLIAWTVDGMDGIRAVRDGSRAPSRVTDSIVVLHDGVGSLGGWTRSALGRASAGWGHQTSHGVWMGPAELSRDEEGDRTVREWRLDSTASADDLELRELGLGLLAAIDVGIFAETPKPGTETRVTGARTAAPKLYPYTIRIARAWSRPGYHAVIIQATPPAAAAAMAKVGAEGLVPTLDASTGWTVEQLRGLRLSDRRVAADELRDRETGLCIALDRPTAATEPTVVGTPADTGRAAVERALAELDGPNAGRYRWSATEEAFDATTITYVADTIRSAADWDGLDRTWRELGKAVALYARNAKARLETEIDPPRFIAILPKASPEYPSGSATDWAVVTARYPASRRHPLRVIAGLEHDGTPAYLELGDQTPHLLVAGATGSGKSVAARSILAQLLANNGPDRLRVHILDSIKRETVRRFGDAPHVERAVIAEDGDEVVAMLDDFVRVMDDRYRALGGQPIGADEPVQILMVEEWADLRDLLERGQLESVERSINRIGQLGRAAGMRLILVTQKATSQVLTTRMKLSFAARISGYLPNLPDYGALFDRHSRLLPNVTGRLAVSDGATLRIVQGLHITDEQIADIVSRGQAGRPPVLSAGLRAPTAPRTEPDDPLPRRPTVAEVDALDVMTAARCLYRWQAEQSSPLVATVRGLMNHVREEGFIPGRTDLYTDAMARLERIGILRAMSDFSTAPRRLIISDWPTARAIIEAAEVGR